MYVPNALDPLWEYLFMEILKEWFNVYIDTDIQMGIYTDIQSAEFVIFYLEICTHYLFDIEQNFSNNCS